MALGAAKLLHVLYEEFTKIHLIFLVLVEINKRRELIFSAAKIGLNFRFSEWPQLAHEFTVKNLIDVLKHWI